MKFSLRNKKLKGNQNIIKKRNKKISKWGGGDLKGPQFLEGGYWERGAWPLSEGLQFLHKNKLKSEITNDKKSLQIKMFFYVITKN